MPKLGEVLDAMVDAMDGKPPVNPQPVVSHPLMDFSQALLHLRAGSNVTRKGWANVKWLCFEMPNESSRMSLPYISARTKADHLIPWVASQLDILAEDWYVVRT